MNNTVNDHRIKMITKQLNEKFHPNKLTVTDESHRHVGHAGAKDGRGHFSIEIVSSDFENKSRIERHRLVYDALEALMKTDIHALRIKAITPNE